MEDRYLFKAKTARIVDTYNNAEDGIWVKGSLREDCGKYTIFQFEFDRADYVFYEVDPSTICQCTGLKDKNGKLIWENDIVGLYNENKEKRYAVGSVEYGTFNCSCCDGVYGWYFTDSADIRDSGRYEVIGNIFDNPELLESEE